MAMLVKAVLLCYNDYMPIKYYLKYFDINALVLTSAECASTVWLGLLLLPRLVSQLKPGKKNYIYNDI